jgi:thiamine-monophosphate kinase
MERTELKDLGEFGLIERIKAATKIVHPSTKMGIGDDAAVIDNGATYTLVSTDMLLEGIHFDLSYVPLKHLGYKAVTSNLSDIAAMNGFPKQITVNIGISNRFSLEAIDELYKGIHMACENYNVDLVGGDTSSSRGGLVISITAIGEVGKSEIAYRSGAKVNDVLCATGDLGAAYMGLQVLEREKQVFLEHKEMQPQLDDYDYIVSRQLKPEGRTDVIHELRDQKVVPTSMIDISDGLASEVLHLSKASGLGFNVFSDNLPIDHRTLSAVAEFNLNPLTIALNGGEDYELLMTISQADYEKVKGIPEITPIGFVTEEKENVLVTNAGERAELQAQGWVHI